MFRSSLIIAAGLAGGVVATPVRATVFASHPSTARPGQIVPVDITVVMNEFWHSTGPRSGSYACKQALSSLLKVNAWFAPVKYNLFRVLF